MRRRLAAWTQSSTVNGSVGELARLSLRTLKEQSLLSMKLQLMRRGHLADCARLYAAVFNSAPWRGKWTARTAAKHIRESFQDPNFRGIVALEENKPVAFAYGVISQWENERHFYLKEMCVPFMSRRHNRFG